VLVLGAVTVIDVSEFTVKVAAGTGVGEWQACAL
jgi:hypothetical protein